MKISKDDPKYYLQEGKQTKITPRVRKVAEKINGEGLEFVSNLLRFISEDLHDLNGSPQKYREYLDKHHLRKTANEILANHLAPTCGDTGLAFAAICRAKGLPTKLIEGALIAFLENPSSDHVATHVFAEVATNGRWYLVDPSRRLIGVRKTLQNFCTPYAGWEPFWEGLDFWDVGIHNHEDLIKKTLEFKRRWRRAKKLPPSAKIF